MALQQKLDALKKGFEAQAPTVRPDPEETVAALKKIVR